LCKCWGKSRWGCQILMVDTSVCAQKYALLCSCSKICALVLKNMRYGIFRIYFWKIEKFSNFSKFNSKNDVAPHLRSRSDRAPILEHGNRLLCAVFGADNIVTIPTFSFSFLIFSKIYTHLDVCVVFQFLKTIFKIENLFYKN
jgi:hypothetical protein